MSKPICVCLHSLAEDSLPLNSTSPSGFAEAMTRTLERLKAEGVTVNQIVVRPYGRTNYFFGIGEVHTEPEPKKTRAKTKTEEKAQA